MKAVVTALLIVLAAPAADATSLCEAPDDALADLLAGTWTGEPRQSIDSLDTARIRAPGEIRVRLAAGDPGLAMTTGLLDNLGIAPLDLRRARPVPYDVDRVDDVLDTTDNAVLADLLSDTPCGPESLPQFSGTVGIEGGIRVEGTITIVAYFTDRLLGITELTLQNEGATLYLTETVLLRPAEPAPGDG